MQVTVSLPVALAPSLPPNQLSCAENKLMVASGGGGRGSVEAGRWGYKPLGIREAQGCIVQHRKQSQ